MPNVRHISHLRLVWPTDLESIPHASAHTSIIPTKFEAPMPIRSWVTSDNVSHRLPLKMLTRPLRMRRFAWPVSRGSKTITFLESPTPNCLFTTHLLLGATMTIKGRLLSSVTNGKALDYVNFLCVILWPWPLIFWPWTVVVHGGSRVQPFHQIWRP